jgi:hypothetical protein
MISALIATVAASMIHISLKSGAIVNVDYSLTSNGTAKVLTLPGVNEKGREIGEWIWNDFCKSSSNVNCELGEGYSIQLSLLPNSCEALVNGKQGVDIGYYYDCTTDLQVMRGEREIVITPYRPR